MNCWPGITPKLSEKKSKMPTIKDRAMAARYPWMNWLRQSLPLKLIAKNDIDHL